MSFIPLSHRLLNEQGVVNFLLLNIVDVDDLSSVDAEDIVSVVVQEADKKYMGQVQRLQKSRTVDEYREQLDRYNKFSAAMKKWEALSPAEKAKKKAPTPVPEVLVQINRVTHEQFPYMQ